MKKTMKAAVVRELGSQLSIEERPVPTPGPGEILVKIRATGVCHTDLHAADGDWLADLKAGRVDGRVVLEMSTT